VQFRAGPGLKAIDPVGVCLLVVHFFVHGEHGLSSDADGSCGTPNSPTVALFPCPSYPNPREGGCHAAAKIYFEAVRHLGRSAFVKGQMGVIKDCKLGSRDACIKSIERRADL
jgi:hypothetical protein